MNTIKQIIITGDMLRPSIDGKGSNQKINIMWLYEIFRYQLETASGLAVKTLNWDDGINSFNSKRFYALNNLASLPKDWIKIYNYTEKDCSQESKEYFFEFFKNSIVIGFELPTVFINLLESMSIIYIDLIIHPIRYLDDMLFGFRTNNLKIFRKLQEYQVHTDLFYIQANIHKATISRMKSNLKLSENSAIFTGQVEIDKSLISNNKILDMLHYQDKFFEITKKHSKILYKKHPYANPNIDLDNFLKKFDNVELIDENFYYLLSQPRIDTVYSISSSTVLEAKYFSKKAEYFYKNPFNILKENEKFNSDGYISIYNAYFNPVFWVSIFTGIIDTKKVNSVVLPEKTNRLRNSLQNYWGYNFLDSDILINNVINQKSTTNKTLTNIKQNNNTKDILHSISAEVQKQKQKIKYNAIKVKKTEIENNIKTRQISKIFELYLNSPFFNTIKKMKKIPFIGHLLLFIKRKILKWNL